MKYFFLFSFFLYSSITYSQTNETKANDTIKRKSLLIDHSKDKVKAKINQYRVISLKRDTVFVDTSLTIQKEYKFNYLRKDTFGLLPFANEGQTYNTLNFGLTDFSALPEIGFNAKQFNFYSAKHIHYYSVATPFTDLYYKSVMEQGQTLDAIIALNTSERLNFSISYKGLRSLGKYINQLSSTGNFVFTLSYLTKTGRYEFRSHYAGQDILNGENGGITTASEFEDGSNDFKNRARVNVFLQDATSFLKGKRFFFDQVFRINTTKGTNNLYINHQIDYENKFYEFTQNNLLTTIGNSTPFFEFGPTYVPSYLKDQTHYNKLYNKVGAQYENITLGKFQFFIDDFRDNSYYYKILVLDTGIIPATLSNKVNAFGGQYDYQKNQWNGSFIYSKAVSTQTLSNLEAHLKYKWNELNLFTFQFQNISKLPNNNFRLYQSSYINYNWYNSFKNEKINTLKVDAKTQWFNAYTQFTNLKDYLYFSNDQTAIQVITPKQYDKAISYFSLQINKEIKYRKWALDNTLLYQKVAQENPILNVPQWVTRNTLYYSHYYFDKALYLQTGITFNYFSKYYGNGYNPVISEFFVQNTTKIGGFPNLDFFINARIRQTRIFLKAEHFNSGFTSFNYYAAPNYPYRDFIIRFGLVWDFFQ